MGRVADPILSPGSLGRYLLALLTFLLEGPIGRVQADRQRHAN